MEKVTGLMRRGSTYSLRRRVPTDLVEALGRREVWIALGTSNYKEAAKEARLASVRLDIQWEQQREALQRGGKITPADKVSEADLRRAVLGEFWKAEQSVQPVAIDDGETREGLHHEIGGLEVRDPSAEAALVDQARSLIHKHKLNIPLPAKPERGKLPPKPEPFTASPELLRLIEMLRRADIERLRRMLDRMDGHHGDLSHDPLFAGVHSVSPPPASAHGTTLGEAIMRFESDPTRAQLGVKAGDKYKVPFRAMKEIIGADRPFPSITRAECAEVQEVLAGLPVNFPKLKPYKKCETLRAIATLAAERGDKVLSQGGVRVHTHALSSFFNWGIRKGLIQHNPATRMAPARGPAEVSRRPFSIEELNKIVTALPDWSKGRKPARYWVPLIAIFSGMRLGEIVSLTVDDIGVRDGVECFILRRTEDRSLKTPGSERVVPIHPELIRLGLLQRVAKSREDGVSRLFPDIEGETQKDRSTIFQKRFSYLQKTVLKITERGVSFHCFRHGFRDALREAGVPIDATRALGGWARSGGVEERYGQGTRPATLARWMAEVRYDGLVLPGLNIGS
ncbi:site-specific integrase [Pseudaminobacter sp. 19-2017]|uniref:Site-specific integrase n=1 Tax=Pseudaminobacter soli (ex Zhang et al. 2022) TaxID=2831468 RepID=A0A942E3I5_9HYPH|nr:site-specific integrase [Pseudaminobacter soli]